MLRSLRTSKRTGFTLVELLVVLIIIGMLIGLLLPAIQGAIVRAKEAGVDAEILSLGQCLTTFRANHGQYPPSRIVLCEDGNYTTSNLTAKLPAPLAAQAIALTPRSITALRAIWPRVQTSTTGPLAQITPTFFYDFNGNGMLDPPMILDGRECLVFFLGGIPKAIQNQNGSTTYAVTGFTTSPVNPFANDTVAPNRTKPDYDFSPGRLVDSNGNGFPEYVDTFGGPSDPGYFAYFASYEGLGYDPDDVNLPEPDDTGTYPSILGAFFVSNDPTAQNAANQPGYSASPPPNPYTVGPSVPPSGIAPTAWLKPQTYQILTPGRDRLYGIGGQFTDNSTTQALPYLSSTTITGQTLDLGIRGRERDNLTNLSAGRLD